MELFADIRNRLKTQNPVNFSLHVNSESIVLDWKISHYCNLGCSYCFFDSKTRETLDEDNEVIESVIKLIAKSDSEYMVNICGGEPFLISRIYEILEKIKRNSTLVIGTNLINCDINRFISVLDPSNVAYIQPSYHFPFMNKKQKKIFIDKYLTLQSYGYNIVLGIVNHPRYNKNKMVKLIDSLRERGVNKISLKTFIGNYRGKTFPQDYDKKSIEFIKKHGLSKQELDIATLKFNRYKQFCLAGNRYFHINMDGTISDCDMLRNRLGNVKDISNFDEIISERIFCKKKECYCLGPLLNSSVE